MDSSFCDSLVHPFQKDPGFSQRQRVMEELLSGSSKIDGRKLADLLDYFSQLSRHINYYDSDLHLSDWQPFFQRSIPFSLAAIIKFSKKAVSDRLDKYDALFDRHPSRHGLQLILNYIFYNAIQKINTWHLQIKGSSLPVEPALEKAIKDKLSQPVKKFICLTNLAVDKYCVKRINFSKLAENEVWNLQPRDLSETKCLTIKGRTKRERLKALKNQVKELYPVFLDMITVISTAAEMSIEQSLIPLKEELQKKHTPHLGLLFAFLKLFNYLQNDLNGYTKKHLDFFYQQVLKIKPREAGPDKAHIIFEIQKQLDKYLLKKGLLLKDGKDDKKAEIFFALDDEIVVNKAQVADKRTLFLNNETVYDTTYVEGVYMAPDAGKADGVDKDFKDDPKNFPTLGAKESKYLLPESKLFKPYPNARLGFILASPVLLLNEGIRTVDINLFCVFEDNYCGRVEDGFGETPKTCCDENITNEDGTATESGPAVVDCGPGLFPAGNFFQKVNDVFYEIVGANKVIKEYYYISEVLIQEAVKKGIAGDVINDLQKFLIKPVKELCYCEGEKKQYDTVVPAKDFDAVFTDPGVRTILSDIFKRRRAFSILFSGKDGWVEPTSIEIIELVPDGGDPKKFQLHIKAMLDTDKPAVTFADKDKLKEDFNTGLPLVKIELDDAIKIELNDAEIKNMADSVPESVNDCCPDNKDCCVIKEPAPTDHHISLYHFFRNVFLDKANNAKTQIDVKVCGLKSFIVQNDVGLQDVNAPIYPFGTRPEVIGFDLVNPVKAGIAKNLVGPNFYIGSKEVFCKVWNDVFININWKDKPVDFNEHYKAYWVDPTNTSIYGINKDGFQANIAVLDKGDWRKEKNHALLNPPPATTVPNPETNDNNRLLFEDDGRAAFCSSVRPFEQTIYISKDYFAGFNQVYQVDNKNLDEYKTDTVCGFVRINLQNQDFLHKDYAFVLARQMMALGKFPKEFLEGASYIDSGNTVIVFENLAPNLLLLDQAVTNTKTDANAAAGTAQTIKARADTARGMGPFNIITNNEYTTNPDVQSPILQAITETGSASTNANIVRVTMDAIKTTLSIFNFSTGTLVDKLAVLIPNEPWTPIIKEISIDYTATAKITDIDLIHLHPYKDTYQHEEIELGPALFPTFCDEGTLFIGLKDLVPGNNLNMLFQLAEATADSESEREELHWYYLDNNVWKPLREDFEVLNDATDGLTTSGIVKFALPENMTKDNSILPRDLYWIKASIQEKSRSVSETFNIHTQAIRVVFTNEEENDKLRLSKPLPAGAISKLKDADANVKKVEQPYDSFEGRVPEIEKQFYVRVSELLRHKGRAIQKFDYERLALEAFPQLFKVKCINHSFALDAYEFKNDFPFAPGYVILAVIPDLNQLKAGKSFEPRVPVSLLEKIKDYLCQRTSPFVRLRVMNPRYEKINFCMKVKLVKGKDEKYYKEKLQQDLREFLAPWAIGEYDKLRFGQCANRSDIIRFIETRDYIDYIIELRMGHEYDVDINHVPVLLPDIQEVCPKTPRSILIAGDVEICIPRNACEDWGEGSCDNEKILVIDYCKDDKPVNEPVIT